MNKNEVMKILTDIESKRILDLSINLLSRIEQIEYSNGFLETIHSALSDALVSLHIDVIKR